jgi:hypothetical protein
MGYLSPCHAESNKNFHSFESLVFFSPVANVREAGFHFNDRLWVSESIVLCREIKLFLAVSVDRAHTQGPSSPSVAIPTTAQIVEHL